MFSGAWRILWHTKDVLTLGFSVFPLVLFQNPTRGNLPVHGACPDF